MIPGLPEKMTLEQKVFWIQKTVDTLMDVNDEIRQSNDELAEEISDLKQRISVMEQRTRAGRRPKPLVVKDAGVCCIDPEGSDTDCPHASVYRHQQGCRGAACVSVNQEYYAQYREKRKG